MPIVRLGAGQSNSTGKANVFGKQYGDKYGGLASSIGISIAASRGMKYRATKTLAKKIEKLWKLIGGDLYGEAAYDKSGWSVSLSGDGNTVAIGSPSNSDSGHIRIYNYNGTIWKNIGGELDGQQAGEDYGHSVSLSGDGNTVAIGAPGYDDNGVENGVDSGYTRILKYNGTSWNKKGEDISWGLKDTKLGWSVSLSDDGNIVAIGGRFQGHGSAQVYKYNDDANSWFNPYTGDSGVIGSFNISNRIVNAAIGGYCVSLSGDGKTLAIGSINGNFTGKTNIYKSRWDSEADRYWWDMIKELDGKADGEEDLQDYFGHSVSLSGDGKTLAISAINGKNENGINSGYTRIYKYNNDSWTMIKQIDGDVSHDNFGHSVSLSSDGKTLAIGARFNDNENGNNSGYTRIYRDNGYKWNMIKEIPGEAAEDNSGWSVSLSSDGNTVAIGAPYNNGVNSINSGLTQIYKYS